MTNYTKHAVKGLATIFVFSLLSGFLGYIVRLIMARNLAVEEFGLFYAVFAFLASLSLFKSFGFDKSLIRFIPELHHNGKNDSIKSSIVYVAILQFITNAMTITIVYLLANYLSVHFFHNAKAGIVLKLLAIAFFIDSFVVILKVCFQGFQKMLLFSLLEFVRMAFIILSVIAGFRLGYGILSPVLAYILVPIILLVVFGFVLFKFVFPEFFVSRFFIDKKLLKSMSRYSFFIMATGSGALILQYTDTLTLTYFAGFEAVALYNIAFPTSKILTYFPTAIGNLIWPLTSELWAKNRKDLLKAGLEALYKYSMVIMIPLVFVVFSFSDLVISVLFGKQYLMAENPMRVLLIGAIFMTIYSINVYFTTGIGKPEIQTKIFYIAALFNLVGNMALIPVLGVMGAALTTSASYLLMMVASLADIRKFVGVSFPIRTWLKILFIGLVLVAEIYYLKKLISFDVFAETTIILAVSGLLYAVLLFLLKVINFQEIRGLYARIIR